MKMRNKGKVHPSPSASASNPTFNVDVVAVLKLLPAAILTLASLLSLQDKEVLAYMITRSLKTNINPSTILEQKSKKNSIVSHRPPMFECECFVCYTSYWAKWNSSSNRELIHQAIEAFEEHLTSSNVETSSSSSKNKGKSKKRDKMGRRGPQKVQQNGPENQETSPETVVSGNGSPEMQEYGNGSPENVEVEVAPPPVHAVATEAAGGGGGGSGSHKGLARKVLPELWGLFSSRLLSLWGPNV